MPRRYIEGQDRRREDDLWGKVGEPGPGAHCRGYVRYSYEAGRFGLTIEGQKEELRRFAEPRQWIIDGFDVEPERSAKYENIEERPVFAHHLQAADRGEFQVSLCYMNDRWARNKVVAYLSLSRLRKVGVWWATTDGKWNIDRIEEDGWDIAYTIDVAQNAAYSRKTSEKTRLGKRTRAALGIHNGDISYGYQAPDYPPRPPQAPMTWKPPRMPAQPHSQNFARLQQIGEWLAAGISDGDVASRCNALGWRTQTAKAVGPARKRVGMTEDGSPRFMHEHVGPRPFSKDTIRAMRLRWYHREFAEGTGKGTIWTTDGQRLIGQHVAAWSWELWHRIDEAVALRRGGRDQQRGGRGLPEDHLWLFSGTVVCATCGNRLRADGNYSRSGKHYGYYRDEAQARGLSCSEGGRLAVREEVLEQQFYELLERTRLPEDFHLRLATVTGTETNHARQASLPTRRRALEDELERVRFQHQHGLIKDGDLLREVRRIRSAIEVLPEPPHDQTPLARSVEAAETLVALVGYWGEATRQERVAFVRLLVLPEGLFYDLRRQHIAAVQPYPAFLRPLHLALSGWKEQNGVLHAPD
jgi:DNA invertase Pin-like site-specific DNA recombinase